MRVLWFSMTPSLFCDSSVDHNGGGWIASLEQLVRIVPGVELGVAFDYPYDNFKEEQDGVVYYPIHVPLSLRQKIARFLRPLEFEQKQLIPYCLKIVDDFQPDIIHVFGSENYFGLLSLYTERPVIVHMQGCLPPYYNARFPVSVSFWDVLFSRHYSLAKKITERRNWNIFRQRAKREENILRNVTYYLGRTHWDRSITLVYNPKSQYFYCSEVLRDAFYDEAVWSYSERGRIVIVSTLSTPLYKGLDVVLKTAKILKEECKLDFVWRVMGIDEARFIESHYRIKAQDVFVELLGCVSAEEVKQELLRADFYVHPSYIDNSPNSVCEAQMLGVPVVCCNVGGVSSLVEDGETGFLVPANDPIKMADVIAQCVHDEKLLSDMSEKERSVAGARHSKEQILSDLLNAYSVVCKKHD